MDDGTAYDFRQRIRDSFQKQAAMETIGAELTSVQHGMVEIELPFDVKLTQQHGILHAGIISAALDSACGFAAYSVIDPDASILTIEFKVNLMSPGRGERILRRGVSMTSGKSRRIASIRSLMSRRGWRPDPEFGTDHDGSLGQCGSGDFGSNHIVR